MHVGLVLHHLVAGVLRPLALRLVAASLTLVPSSLVATSLTASVSSLVVVRVLASLSIISPLVSLLTIVSVLSLAVVAEVLLRHHALRSSHLRLLHVSLVWARHVGSLSTLRSKLSQ